MGKAKIPPDKCNLDSVATRDRSRFCNNLLVLHLDLVIWGTYCTNMLSFLYLGQQLNLTWKQRDPRWLILSKTRKNGSGEPHSSAPGMKSVERGTAQIVNWERSPDVAMLWCPKACLGRGIALLRGTVSTCETRATGREGTGCWGEQGKHSRFWEKQSQGAGQGGLWERRT